MRKLIQLSAFFRNDKPNGIGVTLTEDIGDLDYILRIITDNYDVMYREAVLHSTVHELVDDLLQQLLIVGVKKERSDPELFLAIGNIYLLSKYGFLRTDDFNGLMLTYVECQA